MVNIGQKKLIFIGMPGSGKSTLAKLLSRRYNKTVFDCDEEFSRRYGAIDAFWTACGESGFREKERTLLIEAATSNVDIISCGGGAVLCKSAMNALRVAGDIVYLTAPANVLKARTQNSSRPLKNDIDGIFEEREPLYDRYADYTVDTSAGDMLDALEKELSMPRKNRYDVVLCDADDTVLDFQAAMRQSIINTKIAFGIKSDDETLIAAFRKCTDDVFLRLERGEIERSELGRLRFEMLCEILSERLNAEQANARFFEEMKKTRCVRTGALEFLKEVRARGIKVFIATNSFTHIAVHRLKALEGYTDGAFISQEVGFDKPNVKYFEHVYDEIGRPNKNRMLMFGDSNTSDIAGGQAFGIDTCFFDPSGKKRSSADFCVSDYAEVLSLV